MKKFLITAIAATVLLSICLSSCTVVYESAGTSDSNTTAGTTPDPIESEKPKTPVTPPVVIPETKVELSDGFKAELENHWGKDEITALVEAGVVNGVSETTYAPNATVNPTGAGGFSILQAASLSLPTGESTSKQRKETTG